MCAAYTCSQPHRRHQHAGPPRAISVAQSEALSRGEASPSHQIPLLRPPLDPFLGITSSRRSAPRVPQLRLPMVREQPQGTHSGGRQQISLSLSTSSIVSTIEHSPNRQLQHLLSGPHVKVFNSHPYLFGTSSPPISPPLRLPAATTARCLVHRPPPAPVGRSLEGRRAPCHHIEPARNRSSSSRCQTRRNIKLSSFRSTHTQCYGSTVADVPERFEAQLASFSSRHDLDSKKLVSPCLHGLNFPSLFL